MLKSKVFQLDIITPNGTTFSKSVIHVNAPGRYGRFGVLVNHIPSIILLTSGNVLIQAIGENKIYNISGGVAYIQEGTMKILTLSAQDSTALRTESKSVNKIQ